MSKSLLRTFHCLLAVCLIAVASTVSAQNNPAADKELYNQIKSFSLGGGSISVSRATLTRDRVEMVFTGTLYLATPVNGRVTGAVFVGDGKFTATVPPSAFEIDNVKRLLGADVIESDFKTAVLRFSDDSFEKLGQQPTSLTQADKNIQETANDAELRILKETGANLSARIALSILNQEKPGFFFGTFSGGKRGTFSFIMDYQNRIPVANFAINGGEKGLIFNYQSEIESNEVWEAFYGLEDYNRRVVSYSDLNDLIDVDHYNMNVDLRDHKKSVHLRAGIDFTVRFPQLRAISFRVGESLPQFESLRLKKQMRLQQARLGDVELPFVQEDWEGGFTVFIPGDAPAGQKLNLELTLQGDFMYDAESVADCHYPRSNETWFPRHGYLDRATFDMTFQHPKRLHVASVGVRLSEAPILDDKNFVETKYQMKHPVALVTFALAPFERHSQMVKWEKGGVGDPIPLVFDSMPGEYKAIKEDFIMAELDNSLRYFTSLFGKYPYPTFGAAFHPFGFGQGFPSLLMIPAADRANRYTYVFIAHETAHQWWGDIVTWRSYRDQWLSEGFAEYSGLLYAARRSPGSFDDLLGNLRSSLKNPPRTVTGVGKGRLVDVGPIILGHRLNTRKTFGAYQTLIYNKGALVLRMIHMLLTDPNTGSGDDFFAMMTDFVNRHANGFASTDDFRRVANEYFARTQFSKEYGLRNLDWFFDQWVNHSDLPTYQMEYRLEDQPNGKVLMTGTVSQENVPNDWFMVLPVVMSFSAKQKAVTTVKAYGPKTPFKLMLPMRPTKVELDPDRWVLSENTSTKGS
jgi:hypothetical protein